MTEVVRERAPNQTECSDHGEVFFCENLPSCELQHSCLQAWMQYNLELHHWLLRYKEAGFERSEC